MIQFFYIYTNVLQLWKAGRIMRIKKILTIILCVTLIMGMSSVGTFAEEVDHIDTAEVTEDFVIEGEATEGVEFVIEQTESSAAEEMDDEQIAESEVASEEETVSEENNNAVLEEREEDDLLLESDERKNDSLENEELIFPANRDLVLDDLGIETVEAEEEIPLEDVPVRKGEVLLSDASNDLIDVGTGTNRFYYNDKMLFDNIGNTTLFAYFI